MSTTTTTTTTDCKYGLLYLVASAIAVLRVQLRFVDCINKRKKKKTTTRDRRDRYGPMEWAQLHDRRIPKVGVGPMEFEL